MAVVKIPQTCKLAVKVQTGTNAAGQPVYKVRSFKNLKTNAADSDIFSVGQAIAGLQKYPAAAIARVDEGNLVEQ